MLAPQATRTRPGPVTALAALVLALALVPAFAAPPAITAVQLRVDEQSFRVALQSDAALPAPTVQALANPPRLALDYPGVTVAYNNGKPKVFPVHLDAVQSLKILQHTTDPLVARVIVIFEPGTTGTLTDHIALLPGNDRGQSFVVSDAPMAASEREALSAPVADAPVATISKLLHDKFGLDHDRFTFEADGAIDEPVITPEGPRLLCRFTGAQFKLPASAIDHQFQSAVDGAVVREFQIVNEPDGGVLLLLTLDPPAGFALQHRSTRLANNKVQLDIEYLAAEEPTPAPTPMELPRPPAASETSPDAAEQIAVLAGGTEADGGLTITQIQYQPLDDGGERFILVANAPLAGQLERLQFPDRQVLTVPNAKVAMPAGVGERYTIPLSSDLVKDVQVILKTTEGAAAAQIFWRLNSSPARTIQATSTQVDPVTLHIDFHGAAGIAEPAIEPAIEEPVAAEPMVEETPVAEPVMEEPIAVEEPQAEAVIETPVAVEETQPEPAVEMPAEEPAPAIEMPMVDAPATGAPIQITRIAEDGTDRFVFSSHDLLDAKLTTARFPNRILITFTNRPLEFDGLAFGKTRFFKGATASSVRLMPGATSDLSVVQIALDRPVDQVEYDFTDNGTEAVLWVKPLAVTEPEPMPAIEEPAPAIEEPMAEPVIEEPIAVVEEPAPAMEEPIAAPVIEEPAPAIEEPAPAMEPVLPIASEALVTLRVKDQSLRTVIGKLRAFTSTPITIDPLVSGTTSINVVDAALMDSLNNLAQVHNLEIIRRDDHIHIQPGPAAAPIAEPEPLPVVEEPTPVAIEETPVAAEPAIEEPAPAVEEIPVAEPAIEEPAAVVEEPAAIEVPQLPSATDLTISLDFTDTDVRDALDTIRPLTTSRITADPRVKGPINFHARDISLDTALRQLAEENNLLLSVKNDVYFLKPKPAPVAIEIPVEEPAPAVQPEPEPEPVAIHQAPVAEPEPAPVMEEVIVEEAVIEEPVAETEPEPAVVEIQIEAEEEIIELEPVAAEPEPAIEEPVAIEETVVIEEPANDSEIAFVEPTPEPAIEMPVEVAPMVEETPEPPTAIRFANNVTSSISGLRHEVINGQDVFEIAYTGAITNTAANMLKYPSQLGISIFNAELVEGVSDREMAANGAFIGGTKLWRGGGGKTDPAVRVSLYLKEGVDGDRLRYELNTHQPGILQIVVAADGSAGMPSTGATSGTITDPVHVEINDQGAAPASSGTAPTAIAQPGNPMPNPTGTAPVTQRRGRYFNFMSPDGDSEPIPVVEEPLVTLNVVDAPVSEAIRLIAEFHNLDIVVDPGVKRNVTIRLTDRPLTQAFDHLAAQAGVKWFINDRIYVFAPETVLQSQYGSQYQAVLVYEPRFAPAQQLLTVLRQIRLIGSNDAQVFRSTSGGANSKNVSTATEKLVIRVNPATRDELLRVISEIDSPPVLIRLDVKILQVSQTTAKRSGINVLLGPLGQEAGSVTFGLLEKSPSGAAFDQLGRPIPQIGPPDADIFSGFQRDPANRIQLRAVIQFLENDTDTTTVANPNLTITSGGSGTLFVGQTIPFRSTFQVSDFGRVTQRISTQQVGLDLQFSARASMEDGLVSLSVTPNFNQLQNLTDIGPQTSDNTLTTNIVIPSGESFVVAGLVTDNAQNTRSRLPFFSDIPLIGNLFRSKERQSDRNELIMIFTPTILDGYGRVYLAEDFQPEAVR